MENMQTDIICQSCGMPLDSPEARGTEKDGSPSSKYCRYCYQHGAFSRPELTLEQMKSNARAEMEGMHLPEEIIAKAVNVIPYLERWISQTPFIT